MKIGMVSDSLAHLDFDHRLGTAAALGAEGVEVNTGNWSSAPHSDVAKLAGSWALIRSDVAVRWQRADPACYVSRPSPADAMSQADG